MNRNRKIALFAVAAFFDLLSFVPGLSEITSILGQIVMGCLFFVSGINVFQGKRSVVYVVSTLVEALPFTSFLPMFLIETAVILSRPGKR
ncbi:MAG TPA: hypothetical protein VHD69_00780 [Candidatus Paceibacterota bacterium]|nr:hypothetical protein [Candidatus Paceibacterota bacterium]